MSLLGKTKQNGWLFCDNSFTFSEKIKISKDFFHWCFTLRDEKHLQLYLIHTIWTHHYVTYCIIEIEYFSSLFSSWFLCVRRKERALAIGAEGWKQVQKGPPSSYSLLPGNSVNLFVTLRCTSPSATWQESHCNSWTNDGAKRTLICHSQWIKSWQVRQSLPNNPALRCSFCHLLFLIWLDVVFCFDLFYLEAHFVMGKFDISTLLFF